MVSEDVLTTNRLPTDEERENIKEHLSASDEALRELEAQKLELEQRIDHINEKMSVLKHDSDQKYQTFAGSITELSSQLQSLHKKEAAIIETSNPYRRALSPFCTLPEDVLREICLACFDTREDHFPVPNLNQAPLVLTQISRDIRSLAVTTPILWASIHIVFDEEMRYPFRDTGVSRIEKYAEVIRTWIVQRSGNLPLNIHVTETRTRSQTSLFFEVADKLIAVVLSRRSRWRNVSFAMLGTPLDGVAALQDADVPLLRSLSLRLASGYSNRNINGSIFQTSQFLRAPNFDQFSLHRTGRKIDVEVQFANINWSNLTRLRLSGGLWDTFNVIRTMSRMLRRTINLVDCHLTTGYVYRTDDVGEISLPFLKILSVEETRYRPRGPMLSKDGIILKHINAPNLQQLTVKSGSRLDTLQVFLQRSPNIQDLRLEEASSLCEVAECIRDCPSLTALRIDLVKDTASDPLVVNNAFLEAFVLDDEKQRLHMCST